MRDVELAPEERSLIAAARDAHAPNETQRARVRNGLAVKLAAGVAAPLLATSSAMALVGKVGIGVALLAAAGTTAIYVTRTNEHKASLQVHSAQVLSAQVPAPLPLPGAAPAASPEPPTPVERVVEAPKDPRPSTARSRGPSLHRPPVTAAPVDLAGELTLLTQISEATKRGDVARAERLLADYDQRTLVPQLAQERAAAGILLACAAGRTDSARAQAKRFLEHWPHSPLVARINASCVAEAKTP